jgi:hypothetical protein
MRLLNPTSAFLIPALASTTVLASTAPASTSASATPILFLSENDVQLVEYWSPISTITYLASPTTGADTDADLDHDLLRREIVTGAAAAQPTAPTQLSPITTMQVNQVVNGVVQQVEVVYTQLFSAVPDQGLAPASGSIGLGTIQGQIGVVRTGRKRDAIPEPTGIADIMMERRTSIGGSMVDDVVVVKREDYNQKVERRSSHAGKVDANSAGSALALLVAITVMIVV